MKGGADNTTEEGSEEIKENSRTPLSAKVVLISQCRSLHPLGSNLLVNLPKGHPLPHPALQGYAISAQSRSVDPSFYAQATRCRAMGKLPSISKPPHRLSRQRDNAATPIHFVHSPSARVRRS